MVYCGMTTRSPSEIARELASLRRPKERTCRACGRPFTTVGRGLYCSKACAKRYQWRRWYEAHREEYLARQKQRKRSGPGE